MGLMLPLGIIGGTGWLGGALSRAALDTGVIAPGDLWLSSRRGQCDGLAAWPGISVTTDNAALASACACIVLSVRPEDIAALDLDLSGKLVISVMARVDAAALKDRFPGARLIRAMPNASAEDRLSFTPILPLAAATDEDIRFADRFFSASGKTVRIGSEAELDYYTALTGSGPAFVAAFCDAMIRAAEANGLSPDTALAAVRQLFLGAGTLIAKSEQTPAGIVKTFIDYGGTTAAGLSAMLSADIDTPISKGLAAAAAKAGETL